MLPHPVHPTSLMHAVEDIKAQPLQSASGNDTVPESGRHQLAQEFFK